MSLKRQWLLFLLGNHHAYGSLAEPNAMSVAFGCQMVLGEGANETLRDAVH